MLDTTTHTYNVPGVSCAHCVAAITEEVSPLEGVESVTVDIDTKVVTVVGGSDSSIVDAIGEAGYEVAR